jgi:hypothetical protein
MTIQAAITANSTDLESICTLSGIVETTASDVSSCNIALENELVYDLITRFSVSDISKNTLNNLYNSEKSNTTFYANDISYNLRSQFDITTTKGSNNGNFALSSTYSASDHSFSYSSYTSFLGDTELVSSVIEPTISYYDSTIAISTQPNYGPFYQNINSSNSTFVTYADISDNDVVKRFVNSRYERSDKSDSMYVQENVSFNTTYSLGQDLNSYYTLDETTGEPTANSLPYEYQVAGNSSIKVVSYPSNADSNLNTTQPYYGTYKIELNSDLPEIDLSGVNLDNNEVSLNDNISGFPIVNGGSSLPTILNNEEYVSIFDSTQQKWGLMPESSFSITISDTADNGYSLHDTNGNPIYTDSDNTVNLDNSQLTDNLTYMQEYVNGTHNISFSNAAVRIEPSQNANEDNITNFFSLSDTRETLSKDEFANGQIVLNNLDPKLRTTQKSQTDSLLNANVYYNSEGSTGISTDVQTNYDVEYINQLVFKSSANDINYALSESASFNLYDGYNNIQVINANFDTTDVEFVSNLQVTDDKIDIFKINTSQNLVTIDPFKDSERDAVSNYEASGRITNLSKIVTPGKTLNDLVLKLSLQPLTKLNLYTDAFNSGWQLLNYLNDKNSGPRTYVNYVTSSNASAWPEDASGNGDKPTYWPNLYPTTYLNGNVSYVNNVNEVTSILNDPLKRLNYNISLIPDPRFTPTAFSQYYDAQISWGLNDESLPNQIILNSVQTKYLTNNAAIVLPVASSTYDKSKVSLPDGAKNITLLKYTLINTLQCNFKVGLLPFDNLKHPNLL